MANGDRYDPLGSTVGFTPTHGRGSGRFGGPRPPRTVSQGEWGQPGYQMPSRGIRQYGSDELLVDGGELTEPDYEADMAAITMAGIAGGSAIANIWGQSRAQASADKYNERAQGLARAEVEYDIGENWQTYQRAKPRMQVADSVFRSTIAETGIPGLQRQVAPEVVEGAWEGPPRTLAELEARESGPGGGGRAQAIPSGYMRDMRDPAIDDPTQRRTMGEMLPKNRRV